MTKYRLSNYVQIKILEKEAFKDLPEIYSLNHYMLINKRKHREYVVNSTIKYFIEKFHEPKTVFEVFNEIKSEIANDNPKIKETCYSFFKFLRNQRVLVTQYKNEEWVSPPPIFTSDDVVDHYQVLDIIANRGVTELYKVKNLKTEEILVLKCVNGKKTRTKRKYEDEYKDLRGEYKLLTKTKSINSIVKVQEFIKSRSDLAYFTQELIEGISLMRYIDHNENLSLLECLKIISQFLEGFGGLHEIKLIHGDIHSSNILVSTSGTVKIIDLGMARNVVLEKNEVVKYGGVDFYMPPESINLSSFSKVTHPANLKSDVYQIGILMYIVFYNKLPFDGFTWEELAKNIKETEPEYPSTSFQNFDVPKFAIKILKKCLHREPKKRYENAGEIVTDFGKCYNKKNE